MTSWRRHTRDTRTGTVSVGGRHPVVVRAATAISRALPAEAAAAVAAGCQTLLVRGWSLTTGAALAAAVIRDTGVPIVAEVASTVTAVARARLLGCAGVRLVVRDEEAFSLRAPALTRIAHDAGLSLELALVPPLPRDERRPLLLAEAYLRVCAMLEKNRFTNTQLAVTCTDPLTVGRAARMLAVASDYPLLPVLLPGLPGSSPVMSASALTYVLLAEGVSDGVWLPSAGDAVLQAQLGREVVRTAQRFR
ncbi:flavodoxin-dependent (E)-4-hydroxy-3-methylbut-2-enyl-diphosphate synthase [Lentzea sp. DG1S-22]|uniref:flavodoxin-dependent (E)-4-hydroxy-3-methylbut-2-enyl-diphosphate synthase n=1 Tax=Lentzea sp. DG1S-22 TaxID=3108822 RepID=UPI002E78AB65|nr:flavodoxin-dependent (E)-4-hydroxy-3-methylbut-2-enyl-diphosphate synthase [Lentzea sp. DG1S-22]WVH82384.1 flavodoxin-dependent (E)-4-hydroxy-3-methylbut-2-enyl-diphosphate synthase [Lentzea sp. DG1S-22]